MADARFRLLFLFHFLGCAYFAQTLSSPVSVSVEDVNPLLLQNAINALNEDSPTHHKYKTVVLISAQELAEPPYTVYRLTFNLLPICEDTVDSCPREACTLNLKQHELGTITVQRDTIQCMYLYPQLTQGDIQEIQDVKLSGFHQGQETVAELDRQPIPNQSVKLDHEVQKTTDQNEKPFIAVRASESNYCPGCPYELNSSLPGLQVFGEEIVKSMDELVDNDYKHKVVGINKVTRAVPASSNSVHYQLLVRVGESSCLKNALVERTECPLQTNMPIKTCFVTFEEQPWQESSRVIKSNNCTQANSSGNEVNGLIRSNTADIEGAYNLKQADTVAVNEATYTETTERNTEGIDFEAPTDTTTNQDDERRQAIVTEVPFRKIVLNRSVDDEKHEGFVDKIKEFDEFLIDFDIPIKTDSTSPRREEVPVIQGHDKSEGVLSTDRNANPNEAADGMNRKRRSSGGATSERTLIRQLAQKAVDILDDIDADSKKRVVVDVLDAKKEKASNSMYHLKISVATTNCEEGEKKVDDCQDATAEPAKICHIDIHTDPSKPLQTARVLKSECHEPNKAITRSRRSTLVGSAEQKNVNDVEIKKYAELGLNKYAEISASSNEPILVEITEASVQVVSGLLYKIRVKVGSSNCAKGRKENCRLLTGSEIKECLIKVWSQPWLDHGSPDVNVDCSSTQSRRKRSLKGAHYNDRMLKQAEELKQQRMFERFMQDFGKSYSSEKEKNHRFKVFRKNLKVIEKFQRNEQGTAVYGVNEFADLTYEEFRSRRLGLRGELRRENEIPFPRAEIPDVTLPREFDWRHYNVVTPVKDQGQCGSCWAFAVTGNVEGQYALRHKRLLSLSEQELLDCDNLDDGCDGGLPDNAYRAIENLGGLELESDYPYRARDDKCHFDRREAKVRVVSALNITSDERQMAQWLVKNGPIAIGINANAMQFYMGGISHPFKFLCNPNSLDHGVLIVGYGVHEYPLFKKTLPYWTIKNSWGPRWGEQGYYRIYRGDGSCGLNQTPSSAVVG